MHVPRATVVQDQLEPSKYEYLRAELERLRSENFGLKRGYDRLETIFPQERTVLFEMDLRDPGVRSGEGGDFVVLAGEASESIPGVARQVAAQIHGLTLREESAEYDVLVSQPSGAQTMWHTSVANSDVHGRVVVAAREVTGSRSHLRDLQEKEVLYHRLLDLLPDPVLFTDLNGRLLYINPAGSRLLGATEQVELIQKSIWSFVHADDLRAMRERVRKLLRGQSVDELRVRFVRRDGGIVYVEANSVATTYEGRPAVLSIARDVTEQNVADTAVRESRESLVRIFHASPAPIMLTRMSDGRILDVNAAWTDVTGYTHAEAVNASFEELEIWADPEAGRQFLGRLRADEQVSDVELVINRRNGGSATVLCAAQRIRIAGLSAVLTVVNDITARKQVETKLVEARDRAHEMARIKTSFLTNMTHEIRTPLTVILGFTTMLKQGVDPAYRRFVSVIERSGKRLLLTLDSILDLAQLEAGSLQVDRLPFQIQDAVDNVIESVEPLAKDKGLTINLARLDHPAYAAGGHRIFTRIIHHLLDNAVKFTEAGAIKVRVSEQDDAVVVEVSDTGIGIRSEFLPHIFEEFSQESTGLERTHQGSGLGLAVAQRLAVTMGGRIHVESEKGKGSIFRLTLPRADVQVST